MPGKKERMCFEPINPAITVSMIEPWRWSVWAEALREIQEDNHEESDAELREAAGAAYRRMIELRPSTVYGQESRIRGE
jgi:hypothetical protein